jgi:2-keto-4-pentenoate hydratase/2-oxohepta-3-ene-1,7-dioic acid hydratase in catechol pathway
MKIAQFRDQAGTAWGVVGADEKGIRPLAGSFADWSAEVMRGATQADLTYSQDEVPIADVRLVAPIERTNKVIVIGANYAHHLKKDFGLGQVSAPVAFMKPYEALLGAYDELVYPRLTKQLDFEVELVAVFGNRLEDGVDPIRSILGYSVGNDISARDLQKGTPGIGMDFLSGKGLNDSSPVGPWIVTRDEFGDSPPDLRMLLKVNGETRQDDRTSEMTWHVGELAEFVNARTTLNAGDIMFTGTPAGVANSDGRFLKPGDVVETIIEGVGAMRNVIVGNGRARALKMPPDTGFRDGALSGSTSV